MNDSENKKTPEALADEALEKVSGGVYTEDEFFKYADYMVEFRNRNVCNHCHTNFDNCLLKLDADKIYNMFGGDNNAMCPYKS